MIFYCDLQGNLKAFQNETVYQGSNNVTTIYVVAPFSRPVGLNISFTKPNKLVTSPAIMKWVGTLGNVKIPVSFVNIPEQFTETYNVWAYALPYSITEQNGVVGVSVNAVIADSVDANGQQAYKGNLTTFTGQFTVAYSALPSPPTDIPTEWTQDKVLDLLNNYYNDAIQKIGEMNTLKTNAKDTLVKAINEVFDEIASTNATIGDLSTLTTDEKTTIVGAINEVDQHADTAQQTAETAQTTADNATTLANNAVGKAEQAVVTANEAKTTAQTAESNANSAVDTANAANATAGEAKAIAQGSQRAIGFATLQAAITALNGYSNTQLKVGDNVYIVETGVPDLWVAAVEQNSVAYNYTTNDAFNDDLVENTLVQVGYYKFAYLESDGKPCTVAWQNMVVTASDWVASTEFEDFAYEAKIILSDFVNFSSIPQVVFGLTEATSGNYAPICKAGDKGVYIYSKVNTAITLPTVVTFAPNVHGASMQGGGYNNRGKWVASTTYAIDDLVYTDNGQFVCIEGITSTTSPEQDTTHWQATFVATGKTKNALTIGGQDNGTGVQKTFDGSTAVEIAFDENTMTAKEVNGVLKVGAKGTVPKALPATGAKITGNLPTSGWNTDTPIYEGKVEIPYNRQGNDQKIIPYDIPQGNVSYEIKTARTQDGIYEERITTGTGSITSGSSLTVDINWEITVAYISIRTDGIYAHARSSSPTYYLLSIKIAEVAGAVVNYTISDTAIKANSTVTMYLNSADEVRAISKADGSVVVEMDSVPTSAIPYTLQVIETSAEGAFEIVNSYLPTIPETPTALPQTASALKSGNLPTGGAWYNTMTLWSGNTSSFWNSSSTGATVNVNIGDYTQPLTFRITYNTTGDVKATVVEILNDHTVQTFIHDGHTFSTLVYADKVVGNGVDAGAGALLAVKSSKPVYVITDPTITEGITENSDVLMELTDEGGAKAYRFVQGRMEIIRDSVPTSPIPFTYKVKQTNASGQFTLVNHYVPNIPVTSVNGQTGAVTIAVPTKTSDLQNDSNFATTADIPTKTSELTNDSGFITAADIPTAGEWVNVVSTSYEDKSLVRKFVFPDLSVDLEGKSVEVVYEPKTYSAYTRVLSFGVISLPKRGTATDTQRTVSGFYLRTGTEETETNPVSCYIQINFVSSTSTGSIQVTAFTSLKGDEQPTIKYRKIN